MPSQPPAYRDPQTNHLLPEYQPKNLDLDVISIRIYWWVDNRFSTEKTGEDGKRWGWRWRIWGYCSEKVYDTAAQASWAALEDSLALLDKARGKIRYRLNKRQQ